MQPWGLDGWRFACFAISVVGALVALSVGLFAVEPRPRPPLAAHRRGQSIAKHAGEYLAAALLVLQRSYSSLKHISSLRTFQILIAQVRSAPLPASVYSYMIDYIDFVRSSTLR